jgi:CRP-like cAMP-binding protein
MENLLALAASYPSRHLQPGEILLGQGREGGDLFILEAGQLGVERDGVRLASFDTPGTVIGEMSVVLGTVSSATVKAERPTTVRVIQDARQYLRSDPELTFRIAWLMASRLDSTSAYLVQLTREHSGRPEGGLLGKILASLNMPADDKHYAAVHRGDMFGETPGA